MLKILIICTICLSSLSACVNPHPNCERADTLGHCKQWKDQALPCKNPDFLGFCPPPRN